MAHKPNSLRRLESHGIPYEVMHFPETIRSAQEVAEYFQLPPSHVYKTLVLLAPSGKPLLVLVAANRDLHLRQLAKALSIKRLRMATHKEAESLTGLKVGGISVLALPWCDFRVYIDQAATSLKTILVSAGQRGLDVQVKVADLARLTKATFVAAAPI